MRLSSRTRPVLCLTLGLALFAPLLGGCTPEAKPPAASPTPAGSTEHSIDDQLATVAEAWGIDQPPDVAQVRVVRAAESPGVQAECLTESGFPSEVTPDGTGYSISSTSGSDESLALAVYTCAAMYPIDPTQTGALTEAQKELAYRYLSEDLVSCLGSNGYVISEIPSRQTFIETYDTGAWNPYAELISRGESPPEDLFAECPANPPLSLIYGD